MYFTVVELQIMMCVGNSTYSIASVFVGCYRFDLLFMYLFRLLIS